jgi:hypothetical protein
MLPLPLQQVLLSTLFKSLLMVVNQELMLESNLYTIEIQLLMLSLLIKDLSKEELLLDLLVQASNKKESVMLLSDMELSNRRLLM